MITELFLSSQHPKVVVVTSAEHALGDNLVFPLPPGHDPYDSPARGKPNLLDTVLVNELHCFDEIPVKCFHKHVLHLIGDRMCPADLLASLFQNVLIYLILSRARSPSIAITRANIS